jgi:hypothetical protein
VDILFNATGLPWRGASHSVKDSLQVFVSYSHKDEVLRDSLDADISALKSGGVIELWCDRAIEAGAE